MCTSFGASTDVATFTPGTKVCLVWSETGKPTADQNLILTVRQWSSANGRSIELLRTTATGMSRCIRTQLPATGGLGEYETTIRMGLEEYVLHWQLVR